MDRAQYPVLARSGIVHLDASAAFPLHETVIAAVHHAMVTVLGSPGKAQYAGALMATEWVQQMRQQVAAFLSADPSEIFFVASATDAARVLAEVWATGCVLYSPEDHARIVRHLTRRTGQAQPVAYMGNGEYDYAAIRSLQPQLAVLAHIHHLYGSDNYIAAVRNSLPDTTLVVDVSQSVSRLPIDVAKLGCDALFFSAQKVGGLAGVGVLYIARRHHQQFDRARIEPNTLPLVPLVSLEAALAVLQREGLSNINLYLARMSAELIHQLRAVPGISFTKGPAQPEHTCHGHGIVSFSLEGYTAQDVAMILDDHDIWVRAGDHCIDPTVADQDVVRVSLHRYTTAQDIARLLEVLHQL